MESWSYDSEEKSPNLFPHITDLSVNSLTQTRHLFTGWGINHNSFDNTMLVPNREATKSMDCSVPEMMTKSIHGTASLRNLGGENGNYSRKMVPSFSSSLTPNSLFGFESSSRLSSSEKSSSLGDLEFGKFSDWRETKKSKFLEEVSILSSKRSRTVNMNSQSPVCQVYGCGIDLSSSKDYHKRHKVCDAHSKTSKVIVNGIEQRFCQQCSRFHLLAEFDNGKRSCRKRLAGHNERRRKLQFDTHFDKPKLLPYYQSTSFLGPSLPKKTSSLVFPDIHLGGSNREEPNRPQLATTVANKHSLPTPVLRFHGVGKQNPFITFSFENDYTALGSVPTVKEISGVTNSSCALSLLSAQSQNMPSYSTGFSLATPPSIQRAHDQRSIAQNSNKSFSESNLASGCYSSGVNSVEADRLWPSMVSDSGNSVDFGTHRHDGFSLKSDSTNSHFFLSPGNGHMVDLLQLSSHLQRVEQHKDSVLVKKENDVSYCFQTT